MSKFEILTCRRVLDIMMITSFMCHNMLRINISIAIVDMVVNPNTTSNSTICSLPLTQHQQNNILGIFFIGYSLGSTPSGRLAELFGTRRVLGINMILASLLTILTPAYCNYYYLLASRCLLGVLLAVTWPASLTVSSKWVEPQATAFFTTHMIASAFGASFILLIGGFLIASYGWPSVFYVTGTISLFWTLFWWLLVYDTPAQHPRISNEEKQALEQKMGVVSAKPNVKNVPWMKIVYSGPVWALCIINYIAMFSFFIVFNQQNIYLKSILHFDIKQNGLLSSLPHVTRYFGAVLTSIFVDRLVKKQKYTKTNLKKFIIVSGQLGSVALCLMQTFWGYNQTVSIFYFTSMLGILGYYGVGLFSNPLDICPNFAGTIFGIMNMLGAISGYGGTAMIAYFMNKEQTFKQWQNVFGILAGLHFLGALVFLVFGSGEVQKWNHNKRNNEIIEESEERIELKSVN